jgi:hypothetical protein
MQRDEISVLGIMGGRRCGMIREMLGVTPQTAAIDVLGCLPQGNECAVTGHWISFIG